MKKFLLIISLLIVLVLATLYGMRRYTRSFSPSETIQFEKGDFKLMLSYCRPYKKGRKIFGGLVPYGEVWRTGANEATEISFSGPVQFGGQSLPAGRYTLFTIPGPEQWVIILNKTVKQWGAFNYKPEYDILRTNASPEALPQPVEQFTIQFLPTEQGVDLQLIWDQIRLSVPIRKQS
ncbi:MAG: DUF2911 domain-containing protein [Microscillaceae bacterium]|nr:DUF2911 domain-containing protein [Microscillaceae bacterium]